jgi:membrane protein required for colicin V production
MQAYDLLMLIILALAVVWGAWKGLAWQIASLASIALSYSVALHFRQPLAGVIQASPPWNVFLSMLILFLGTGLIVWIGFNLVSELIERVKLKEFDRQLGALFGAAKGVLLCVLITLFSVALLGDPQRQAICNSQSGYYIAVFLDRADGMIPRELHDVLAPYLDRLDKSVPHLHAQNESLPVPLPWERPAAAGAPAAPTTRGGQVTPDLRAIFGGGEGAAPSLPASFPTGESSYAPPAPSPLNNTHTARHIEAQPAAPAGSFPR